MNFTSLSDFMVTPFLRWTGSKRWFVNGHLETYLPNDFNNYHELFLGAGAVFFFLKAHNKKIDRQFYISDSNSDLINTYIQIRDNPDVVIKHLKKMKNSSIDYYRIRDLTPRTNEKKAARFIYLNKTSFNGIYRVNSAGKYNVPYGRRKNVEIVNEELLKKVSFLLRDVEIKTQNFESALSNIKKDDLVFLDPPYTVAHENNGFIEYNQKLFSWGDQIKLKALIEYINEIGAFFILTNAYHYSIKDLYCDCGVLTKLSRNSQVGGKACTRKNYNEVVICNTIGNE